MKKFYPKTSLKRQQRVAEKRERKRLKKIKIHRKRAKPAVLRQTHPANLRTRADNREVAFNRDIDIYDESNRDHLIQNCKHIRENENSHLHLHFKQEGMKMFASGTLLLYAEVYRKATEGAKITCNYPPERKAEQVMQRIGFFDVIGKSNRISDEEIQASDEDVRSWHATKGTLTNLREIDDFLSKITNIPRHRHNKVNVAVKELIANATEHAYEEDSAMRHWVMFGRKKGDDIIVVVGDLGRTIPVTIQKRPEYRSIMKELNELGRQIPHKFRGDSKLIKLAAGAGGKYTTRMRLSHRGLGLEQAINNITHINGRLSIYSRRGSVQFSPGSEHASRKKLKFPLQGTIIEITVPMGDSGS